MTHKKTPAKQSIQAVKKYLICQRDRGKTTSLCSCACNDKLLVLNSFCLTSLCLKRERKSFWQFCIATWRSMGPFTMRRSAPQRCPPLSRTTVCCLSRSCSSCSERPRWERNITEAFMSSSGWIWEALGITSRSSFSFNKLFIGFGFPYEGPAPLEAIANGCIFLQPKFNPPHSSLNHEFFRGKPTSRKVDALVFYGG